MKVEDLPAIVKRELAKVGMVENGSGGVFTYSKFHLLSFKKTDAKWHVTAGFEERGDIPSYPYHPDPIRALYSQESVHTPIPSGPRHTVKMVIDDESGEVTEMTTDGRK
jgi:hypothetical protein